MLTISRASLYLVVVEELSSTTFNSLMYNNHCHFCFSFNADFFFRYYLKLVVRNIQAFELTIDKISLSPFCFGLGEGVNSTILNQWSPNMTDEKYCDLYGKWNTSFLYPGLNL